MDSGQLSVKGENSSDKRGLIINIEEYRAKEKDSYKELFQMPDRRDQCRDVSLWQNFPMPELSSIAKEIWKPMNLRKFGYDISKRPNADCPYTHYM